MKTKCIFIVLPFLLYQSAYALNNKPEACPSVSAIEQVSVNHPVHHREYWQVFAPKNRYDTKEEWQFSITLRPDINGKDIVVKANEVLPGLLSTGDPEPSKNGKVWGCVYMGNVNGERGIGFAMTPPDETHLPQLVSHFHYQLK